MNPQLGPMNTNPESEEETPTALDPPKMRAASKPRSFMCPQCPMAFNLKKHLKDHMKVHPQDNPYECPLCNKALTDNYKLTAHLRSHTGEKPFKCPADGCGKVFAVRDSLVRHTQAHHGEKMEPKPTCAVCGTTFAHIQSLRNHNFKYHSPQAKQHPCVTCGKVFILLCDLRRHLPTHHGEKMEPKPTCAICGTTFARIQSLRNHNFKYHSLQAKEHPCGTCGKVYVSSTELKRHLETHLPDDPQNCPICGTSCRNGITLKEHIQKHGWVVREGHKCEHCAKNFQTSEYLNFHIRTVHSGQNRNINHVPSLCGLKLSSASDLAIHLMSHTGVTPYPCDKCGETFGDHTDLKMRRLAIHPEEARQTPTHTQVDPLYIPSDGERLASENKPGLNKHCSAKLDIQVGPTNANPESQEKETPVAFHSPEMGGASEPRPFSCPHCPKTYRLRKHLNEHIKVHCPDNQHVCPLCDKVCAASSKLTRHMRSHTGEKLFKCSAADGCGKEFGDRYHLEFHMRTHTEPKPICAICGASFTNILSLNSHNWKYHNPQAKQHPCVTCGKVFILSTELKRHLQTHSPDDPQDCPICGKCCRNGIVLKDHVNKHSRLGSNNCEQCLKNFTSMRLLQRHIRTVHDGQKDTKNKNHACSFCGWKFRTAQALTAHLTTHTGERPFKCPTCSKAFPTKKALQRHSKLHTGKNLEECHFCGRRFTLSSNLTLHLRIHTGWTPYKCGKALRGHSSLERHKTAAHSGEQQREASTHARADSVVPMDPITDTPNKNTKKNDPLAEIVESCSQLYLDKGFHLQQLTIPVQRMTFEKEGGGVLELRSGGECWYVCCKCGRGSKSLLLRSHTLLCEVHQSNTPINGLGQTIM